MRALPLLLALFGCARPPEASAIDYDAEWTDADRIGTSPDFYERAPRNILMISVDTFRRDHIGALGGDRRNTPTLDTLIEGGVVWADHSTCSNWTFAGMTCAMRGAYNVENGFIPKIAQETRLPVPYDAEFLSTWLSRAGFFTAVHSGNSWYSLQWGTLADFDVYVTGDKDSATTVADAGLQEIDWRANDSDQPWFLHLHLMEPHAPYDPPGDYLHAERDLAPLPFDFTDKDKHYEAVNQWPNMDEATRDLLEQHLRVRYQGEIRWWDHQLADILIQADARGLLDDTLVVVWNDHGEQFWEHGYQSHAYTLYREENDGWVVFWAKNIVPQRWEQPTVAIDMVPTLLALHDLPIPAQVTGWPMGQRPADEPRYATSVARLGAVQAVRVGQWKMNYSWAGQVRVYDLEADPGEQQDRFDPDDPKTRELWDTLKPWVELTEPLVPEHHAIWPGSL